MAAGKTTAVRYIQEHAPYVNISYEENSGVIREVQNQRLNKEKLEDYVQIQKLWIQNECRRYQKAKLYPCSIMDFGAEEIEFYTLHYPITIEKDWDIAAHMKKELSQLQACMPDRILFLDADEQTLRRNKENDQTRSRTFFEYYIEHLLPLKREWFIGKPGVDVLQVNGMTPQQLGEAVKNWVDSCLKKMEKPKNQ